MMFLPSLPCRCDGCGMGPTEGPRYHHVDISEEHWRYLGFYWKEQHYVFKVLPFGLSTACCAFTKLLRPLVCYWRSRGIRAVLYIDDIIVAFSALELAAGNLVAQVKEDIGKAGLTLA